MPDPQPPREAEGLMTAWALHSAVFQAVLPWLFLTADVALYWIGDCDRHLIVVDRVQGCHLYCRNRTTFSCTRGRAAQAPLELGYMKG